MSSKKSNSSLLLDDGFSAVSSQDLQEQEISSVKNASREEAVSINLSARNYTKLEVVSAKQVGRILFWFHSFILFGISFSLLFVILANTVYLELHDLHNTTARYYNLPTIFNWLLAISGVLCFLYAISLATLYTSRMIRIPRRDRTHEQVWVILLTVSAALYLNPYENVARIMAEAGYQLREERWHEPISRVYDSVREASFSASTVFYVWATVHSYRIVNGRLGLTFYVPKVGLVLLYLFLKQMAFWKSNIYMSEMPVASFVAMLYLYRTAKHWPLSGVICVTGITIFELVLVGLIISEIRTTRQFLKAKDYVKYRVKQIGIRFFLYHNLTFYLVFWACYMLLLLGLPPGAQLAAMKIFGVSYVEVQYIPFGLSLLYLSYITVEAYMNLPADAVGLRGWLEPQPPKLDSAAEPITYRRREVVDQCVQVNCFVMQTHVILFNFAWLVYYYETAKMQKIGNLNTKFLHEIDEVVSDKVTDTHVLLVSASDRIIVSFRGTSSARNLRTDLKAFHVKINRVLPTYDQLGGGGTSATNGNVTSTILSCNDGHQAKIHRGFAEAYQSVAARVMRGIERLITQKARPVFLTGHSLGGALANICAFDCALRLELGPRDLYVATFGSPRVGNRAFRRLYDTVVPASWRMTIAADIVTKLPKVGYEHVGKKIMLTTAGDLFIDPSSLELSLWNGDGSSFVHHRKSAYMLAMKSWCNRHEGQAYRPPFWDWPYSDDDERRWPDAAVGRQHPSRHRSLLLQDAMIDALDGDKGIQIRGSVVERWAQLTRKVLLKTEVCLDTQQFMSSV